MPELITEYPQFFTATNLEWKKLLKPAEHKEIIINSLRFLVKEERIRLFSFVIMVNHIHLIWQMRPLFHPANVQRDFMKYTAQQIKHNLRQHDPAMLELFRVNAADRDYQLWERNALSIELRTTKVFKQKLNYIHWNPVKAGLCSLPEDYKYSSAFFYKTGIDNWGFLTDYRY